MLAVLTKSVSQQIYRPATVVPSCLMATRTAQRRGTHTHINAGRRREILRSLARGPHKRYLLIHVQHTRFNAEAHRRDTPTRTRPSPGLFHPETAREMVQPAIHPTQPLNSKSSWPIGLNSSVVLTSPRGTPEDAGGISARNRPASPTRQPPKTRPSEQRTPPAEAEAAPGANNPLQQPPAIGGDRAKKRAAAGAATSQHPAAGSNQSHPASSRVGPREASKHLRAT